MSVVPRAPKDREERRVTWGGRDNLDSEDRWGQMEASVPKAQWVTWVHKVPAAILDLLDLQAPREALVSLASRDNWEMLVLVDSKARLDLKESSVRRAPREALDPRARKGSVDHGETRVPSDPRDPWERGELLETEDSRALTDCLDPRVL